MSRAAAPALVAAVVATVILVLGVGPAQAVPAPAGAAPLAAAPASATTATPATSGAQASSTTASGAGVHLVMQSLSPAALKPNDELRVVVRVVNPTTKALVGGRVRLFVNSPVLTTRSAVAAWANDEGVQGGDRFAGVTGAEQALASPLPAGASTDVTIAVSAASLKLGSAWGARGVTVDVLDSHLARLDALRSFVVWTPSGTPQATAHLTVLTPVVADAPDLATGAAGDLAALTSPGGRLSRVLSAATAAPSAGAEVVLDPAVLPQAGSATAGASATSANPGWLAALGAATANGSALLPLHDADLDSLATARAGDLYRLAVDAARRRAGSTLSGSPPVLAWPADGSAGVASLDLASAAGSDALVLSSATVKPGPGRVSLSGAGERSSEAGLVVDAAASAVLATGTSAGSVTGPAAATARLLADAAVAARTGGDVVLATPRSWDPDPAAAGAVLTTLAGAPWVRTQSLGALLGSEPGSAVSLPATTTDTGDLPAPKLRQVDAALARVVPISGAVADSEALLAPVRERAMAATSVAWRGGGSRTAAWRSGIDALSAAVEAEATGVHVVQGSPVTAISSRVSLPITVANTLDQAVTVVVSLRSGTLRVDPEGRKTMVVAARAQQQLSLPVKALASGDAKLTVVLRTTDGALVGTGGVIDVRVRADWEGRGVAAVGGVLGLVLLVGIFRTARRVRRGRRPQATAPPVRPSRPPHSPRAGHRQTGGSGAGETGHADRTDHLDGTDHADRTARRQPEHHA